MAYQLFLILVSVLKCLHVSIQVLVLVEMHLWNGLDTMPCTLSFQIQSLFFIVILTVTFFSLLSPIACLLYFYCLQFKICKGFFHDVFQVSTVKGGLDASNPHKEFQRVSVL